MCVGNIPSQSAICFSVFFFYHVFLSAEYFNFDEVNLFFFSLMVNVFCVLVITALARESSCG